MARYEGKCVVIRDGDTFMGYYAVSVVVPGFRITTESIPAIPIRLLGVQCPEKRQPGGKEASEFALRWFRYHDHDAPDSSLYFDEVGYDNFGRLLAMVTCRTDGENLSAQLLVTGNATPYRSGRSAVKHANGLMHLAMMRPEPGVMVLLNAMGNP